MKEIIFRMIKPVLVVLCLAYSQSSFAQAAEPKIGICLSGGGALGFAHLGVLKALEENGIHPQIVTGTSMGAIIGVFYSAGYSPDSILVLAQKEKMYRLGKLLELTLLRKSTGISTHKKLRAILEKYIHTDSFDSLAKSLTVCVTNLDSARAEYIGSGNRLKDYVIASASIPGIFELTIIDSMRYVDGGVMNNLPAQAIRRNCDVIIGSDVEQYTMNPVVKKASDVFQLAIKLLVNNTTVEGKKACDYLIAVPLDGHLSAFSFNRYKDIFFAGYTTAQDYIRQHPDILRYAKKNGTP